MDFPLQLSCEVSSQKYKKQLNNKKKRIWHTKKKFRDIAKFLCKKTRNYTFLHTIIIHFDVKEFEDFPQKVPILIILIDKLIFN